MRCESSSGRGSRVCWGWDGCQRCICGSEVKERHTMSRTYRSGKVAPTSPDIRRKTFRTRTVAMMISSSVRGERSMSRSNTTPKPKGPGTLCVRCDHISRFMVFIASLGTELGAASRGAPTHICRTTSVARYHSGGEGRHVGFPAGDGRGVGTECGKGQHELWSSSMLAVKIDRWDR